MLLYMCIYKKIIACKKKYTGIRISGWINPFLSSSVINPGADPGFLEGEFICLKVCGDSLC